MVVIVAPSELVVTVVFFDGISARFAKPVAPWLAG
jgi:hypothetical protein